MSNNNCAATTEQILENALIVAKNNGIRIVRGPVFDFCTADSFTAFHPKPCQDKPFACNVLGAVLFDLNKYKEFNNIIFPQNYTKDVCEYIKNDSFYLWKLLRGFNNGIEMTIVHVKDDKKEIKELDKVSKFGNLLAKKYVGK